MPTICYQDFNFRANTLKIINQANAIIEEYQRQGYDLTLRQLYYQFVSRDIIPNRQTEYKRLGSVINDGRLAGMIDWDAITDRTRNLASLAHWNTPASIIEACSLQFRYDKWDDQPNRIEVWIEKEALAGVFQRVCQDLDVPYFSCRGYTSQSEMWAASQRIIEYENAGQEPIILHFGDHDPSGIDMTRDITDRLKLFGCSVEVKRLALNMNQIEQYNPPPNPAKDTDSRFSDYAREHGEESWELDALEPNLLSGLVRSAVSTLRDADLWEEAVTREKQARQQIRYISDNYDQITAEASE